jgi:hypothetical protein
LPSRTTRSSSNVRPHAARQDAYLAEADLQTTSLQASLTKLRHTCPRWILSGASSISTSSGCAAFASRCSFATCADHYDAARTAHPPMHVSRRPTGAGATGNIHKLARSLDPSAGGGGAVRKLLDALVANHRRPTRSHRSPTISICLRCRRL